MIYIASVIIFFALWALIGFVAYNLTHSAKPIEKLKYFDEDYDAEEKVKGNKKEKSSILKSLSGLIPNLKLSEKRNKKIEMELLKADIPITAEELMVIKILSSSCFAFLTYAFSKNIVIVLLIFIVVWNIPKLIILKRKKKRIMHFNEQLNEGTMIISNSLKAGYSFFQAISTVVEETKDPFSKEFKLLLKEMSLGIAEENALKNLLVRVDSEDLRLIINAILIQKDIGGNLSEILDNISDTIRERQKIQNELKTLTAQGKLSGIIVILIPVFLGVMIYLFNREYIMLLFTSIIGRIMLCVAAVNMMIGVLIIKKIISIDM